MNRLRLLGWRYPEWWTVTLAGVAWLVILSGVSPTGGRAHDHHSMGVPHGTSLCDAGMYEWSVMVVAMMFPTLIGPVRTTAVRSLWRRRNRGIALMLSGYAGIWTVAGATLLGPVSSASGHGDGPLTSAAVIGAAALWQSLPVKRWALKHCHRSAPLAASGWRADIDCLRYGGSTGVYCVVSCGVLMVACSLARHSIAAMAGATVVVVSERLFPRLPQAAIVITMWFAAAVSAASAVS